MKINLFSPFGLNFFYKNVTEQQKLQNKNLAYNFILFVY